MEKREQAVKKLERAILDAEAAIRFGTAEPTKRNERREWGLNPMIAVAGLGVREARAQIRVGKVTTVTAGAVQSGARDSFVLDKRDPEKGGPSAADHAYDGMMVEITRGVGKGMVAAVTRYHGRTHRAEVLRWNAAPSDTSSK